jgi:hypothetical protein
MIARIRDEDGPIGSNRNPGRLLQRRCGRSLAVAPECGLTRSRYCADRTARIDHPDAVVACIRDIDGTIFARRNRSRPIEQSVLNRLILAPKRDGPTRNGFVIALRRCSVYRRDIDDQRQPAI